MFKAEPIVTTINPNLIYPLTALLTVEDKPLYQPHGLSMLDEVMGIVAEDLPRMRSLLINGMGLTYNITIDVTLRNVITDYDIDIILTLQQNSYEVILCCNQELYEIFRYYDLDCIKPVIWACGLLGYNLQLKHGYLTISCKLIVNESNYNTPENIIPIEKIKLYNTIH